MSPGLTGPPLSVCWLSRARLQSKTIYITMSIKGIPSAIDLSQLGVPWFVPSFFTLFYFAQNFQSLISFSVSHSFPVLSIFSWLLTVDKFFHTYFFKSSFPTWHKLRSFHIESSIAVFPSFKCLVWALRLSLYWVDKSWKWNKLWWRKNPKGLVFLDVVQQHSVE